MNEVFDKDIHERSIFSGNPEDILKIGRVSISKHVPDFQILSNEFVDQLWDGKRFACCLTHDIDHLSMYSGGIDWLYKVYRDLCQFDFSRKRVERMLEHRFLFRRKFDPYCKSVVELLKVESEMMVNASYFFKTAEKSQYDSYVNIRVLKDLIKLVEAEGKEAGFHAGYFTMCDYERMKEEKCAFDSLVKNKCYGVRQHYLRIEVPDTWLIHEKLGFLYDSSFAYSGYSGFRAGACYPFCPVVKGRQLNLWELPLIVMDGTQLCGSCRNMSRLQKVIKELVSEVKRVNGVFVFLWHNSYPEDTSLHCWIDSYKYIIDLLYHEGAWFGSGREIIQRWRDLV